jgi:hypothetical protein
MSKKNLTLSAFMHHAAEMFFLQVIQVTELFQATGTGIFLRTAFN